MIQALSFGTAGRVPQDRSTLQKDHKLVEHQRLPSLKQLFRQRLSFALLLGSLVASRSQSCLQLRTRRRSLRIPSSFSTTSARGAVSRRPSFPSDGDAGSGYARSRISMMTADVQRKPVMVVSGASYGLGAAVTRKFGGSFQICALARNREKLEKLAEECKEQGEIDVHVCDVSNKDDVMMTCKEILDKHGHVDVLINNASVYECKKLQELSLDSIDSMIDVNLKGTMYMTHSILPSMIDAKAGKIIMVNSVAGTPSWTVPGETAYCASKHGQTGFASALANEVREYGITVTSLHPGGIDTPLQVAAGTPEDVRAKFLSTDDVVKAIEYVLESDPRVLVKSINLWRATFWH
eukprot:TRINITY_DN76110_c0_g1_i1.p1 TRINITY_DN76110_c0_g1~~TRINITY_DN76110_c0_g1_i1.p1  ORF type:complete len:351 (+),score=61.67 TRINITY_DN76110_c0_g1_i1:223-1275(+)